MSIKLKNMSIISDRRKRSKFIKRLTQKNILGLISDAELSLNEPIYSLYRSEECYNNEDYLKDALNSKGWIMSWNRQLGKNSQDDTLLLPLVVCGNKHQNNINKYKNVYDFATNFGNIYLCGLGIIKPGCKIHPHADVRCVENEMITTNTTTWNGEKEGGKPLTDEYPLKIVNIPLIMEGNDCHIRIFDHNMNIMVNHKHKIGEPFEFDPRCMHEADNNSNSDRLILIVQYIV